MTRKVTRAVARILAGQQQKLYLGNLEAKRDWGYAPEYVEAMWRMLHQDTPDDYVIGTGETRSVREFVEAAFAYAGLDWRAYVEIDSRYFRPTEVACLQADATKARVQLGWEPRVTIEELIAIMIDVDLEASGLQPMGHGPHTRTTTWAGWPQGAPAVMALQPGVAHTFA